MLILISPISGVARVPAIVMTTTKIRRVDMFLRDRSCRRLQEGMLQGTPGIFL